MPGSDQINATVNNSRARAYYNNPPETITHLYRNQGGGFACHAAAFQGLTLVPGPCCSCGDCGAEDPTREFAETAVTDANGIATFAFPSGLFSAEPVISATLVADVEELNDCLVTSVSESQVTVRARRVGTLTLAGITLLAEPTDFAGATVHLIARQP